jgi:TolB-like protein/Tfp pilus assembly protein PilF
LPLFNELKRRNVFRVGIAYAITAWLIAQIAGLAADSFGAPDWVMKMIITMLMLGAPIAMVLAWAYELTPGGLRRESDIEPGQSRAEANASKLDRTITIALVLAVAYFSYDKFVLDPRRDAALLKDASRQVSEAIPQIGPALLDQKPSIAVLPFVNMSSDEEQEYFSDGLSEELLNLLAKIPELQVAARTSSFSFKGKGLEIPEIASRLKVAHVLEGSVRKDGNQLRITAQLIQADNGYHLWSESYDRQFDNIFQIQEEIAVAVVDALKITLLGEAPKTRKTDPLAYQFFLEGQYLKRQLSEDSLLKAIKAFKKVVEIDPAYVPAWAELADTYIWAGNNDEFSNAEAEVLADQAIQTAIRTDPDYAFSYYVRGIAWFFTRHSFKKGVEDFQHAFELDPDNAFIVAAIGKGALLTGKYELAITQYQAALAMEPVVPEFYLFLGRAYLMAGRLDDAETSFRKLSSLSSSFRGDFLLFETLLVRGNLEAALAMSDSSFKRAVTHFALGNTAKADEALAELIENYGPYSIAMVYGYRGEADKAFEWLDVMLEQDEYYPTWILAEAAFRSIHSDPRWPLFLEQLGLLEYWLEMSPEGGH